jgi:predicted nucleic acid-binding protein
VSPAVATVFVDTDVFVYVRDSSERVKQRLAAEWLAALWDSRLGRTSAQVLHEYYVTVTRKLRPGLTREDARDDVGALQSWAPVGLDARLAEDAWLVEDQFGLSFWDALIVASARRMRCRYLLSEDFQAGQDLAGLEVVDPFARAPEKVLPTIP